MTDQTAYNNPIPVGVALIPVVRTDGEVGVLWPNDGRSTCRGRARSIHV